MLLFVQQMNQMLFEDAGIMRYIESSGDNSDYVEQSEHDTNTEVEDDGTLHGKDSETQPGTTTDAGN